MTCRRLARLLADLGAGAVGKARGFESADTGSAASIWAGARTGGRPGLDVDRSAATRPGRDGDQSALHDRCGCDREVPRTALIAESTFMLSPVSSAASPLDPVDLRRGSAGATIEFWLAKRGNPRTIRRGASDCPAGSGLWKTSIPWLVHLARFGLPTIVASRFPA